MAKARSAKTDVTKPFQKAAVDWKFFWFYVLFFFCILLIAWFGKMAET